MILKLILSVLLPYYLWVLWKYYRADMTGLLGKNGTEGTGIDEERQVTDDSYTVIGESTYRPFGKWDGQEEEKAKSGSLVEADAIRTETVGNGQPEEGTSQTDEEPATVDDDADYSGIEADEDEESEEDEYVPTPEELEEEEELDAYYPEGNPDFATGYTFEDLQKVHLVLTSDKPDEQARQEALEALPAVMGSDIYETMMNELEGARERVARLMDKSIQ